MKAQNFKSTFSTVLSHVVDDRFENASAKDFELVAKTLWYSEENLVDVLEFTMENRLQNESQQRRLLYMVERFRRFGCVTPEKKKSLKGFVDKWAHLQPHDHDPQAKKMVEAHRLDELALNWGLTDDLSSKLQDVLHFQTRHYADSLKSRHGYSEPGL